ncbi:MAG: hypothetical protein U9O94_03285 [Nanoarchaeota archaeon]|nr:hypothetical protein [Nanoarchaeota archaeon]
MFNNNEEISNWLDAPDEPSEVQPSTTEVIPVDKMIGNWLDEPSEVQPSTAPVEDEEIGNWLDAPDEPIVEEPSEVQPSTAPVVEEPSEVQPPTALVEDKEIGNWLDEPEISTAEESAEPDEYFDRMERMKGRERKKPEVGKQIGEGISKLLRPFGAAAAFGLAPLSHDYKSKDVVGSALEALRVGGKAAIGELFPNNKYVSYAGNIVENNWPDATPNQKMLLELAIDVVGDPSSITLVGYKPIMEGIKAAQLTGKLPSATRRALEEAISYTPTPDATMRKVIPKEPVKNILEKPPEQKKEPWFLQKLKDETGAIRLSDIKDDKILENIYNEWKDFKRTTMKSDMSHNEKVTALAKQQEHLDVKRQKRLAFLKEQPKVKEDKVDKPKSEQHRKAREWAEEIIREKENKKREESWNEFIKRKDAEAEKARKEKNKEDDAWEEEWDDDYVEKVHVDGYEDIEKRQFEFYDWFNEKLKDTSGQITIGIPPKKKKPKKKLTLEEAETLPELTEKDILSKKYDEVLEKEKEIEYSPSLSSYENITKQARKKGITQEDVVKELEASIKKDNTDAIKIKKPKSIREARTLGKKATKEEGKQLRILSENAEIEEEIAFFKYEKTADLKYSRIQDNKQKEKHYYQEAYKSYVDSNIHDVSLQKIAKEKPTNAGYLKGLLKKKPIRKQREEAFDLVGERREKLGSSSYETNLFVEKLDRKLTRKQRQVIPFMIEKTKELPEKYKHLQKVMDKDKEKLQPYVDEIKSHFEKGWKKQLDNLDNMDKQEMENYVTHLWKIPENKKKEVVQWFIKNKNKFLEKRFIPTIREGIEKHGLEPKTLDISDVIRIHDSNVNRSIRNTEFIQKIKDLDKDGISLIQKAKDAPRDWITYNHPILQKVCYTKVSTAGKKLGVTESPWGSIEVKVHPDLVKPLEVVLGSKFDNKAVAIYEATNELVKKAWLSASLFHHGALTETAVGVLGPIKTSKVLLDGISRIGKYAIGGGKKPLPIFDKKWQETARDGIANGLQVGATKDIARSKIQNYLDSWAETQKWYLKPTKTIGKPLAEANRAFDKGLWDFLHDSFKLYAYEHTLTKNLMRAKKGTSVKKIKQETAEFINDTFGGQNWDRVTPKQLQVARWTLLSPDWTVSTFKQALSVTGFGKKHKETTGLRKKMGASFVGKVALYYAGGLQLLNAYFRDVDKRNNPDKYKGQKLSISDYTMLGNAPGHKTHLFAGRNEDGTENYIRAGKQFRELPELIAHPFKKIGGKASPALTTIAEIFTGHSLSGFEDEDLYKKKGFDLAFGMIKKTAKLGLPFSVTKLFDKNSEWHGENLIWPTSKGMTKYKATSLYEDAIVKNNIEGIVDISKHAQRNNLPIYICFKRALENVKRKTSVEANKNTKNIKEAKAKVKSATTPAEKRIAINNVKRLIKEEQDIKLGLKNLDRMTVDIRKHEREIGK